MSLILAPLDTIHPGDLLSQYADWIYFALILIFFISVAGITLRRHFEKPYVKPLIIVVGFMLTVGVFMMKEKLVLIFHGWGIVGTLLLVGIAATIPYGLCRGFGMPSSRAFFVVYVIFYILSWAKYPELYYYLADRNMGLVNLGLLILFVYGVYKLLTMWKGKTDLAGALNTDSPMRNEISNELQIEAWEGKAIEREETKVIKSEIRTISDIESSLIDVMKLIQTDNVNLRSKDRAKIAEKLKDISKREDVFLKSLRRLKQLLRRFRVLDVREIQEMRNRLARATGKEKQMLEREIVLEEEKLKAEQDVMALEKRLEEGMAYFNTQVLKSVQALNNSTYPIDAIPYLEKAMMTLKNISGLIGEVRSLENKLLQLTKSEKSILKSDLKRS